MSISKNRERERERGGFRETVRVPNGKESQMVHSRIPSKLAHAEAEDSHLTWRCNLLLLDTGDAPAPQLPCIKP